MDVPAFQMIQADPNFIDQIVNQIKSQGTFDQWRRECLADVDTKPAYQNLTSRVDNAVASFLNKQKWQPSMVKNQVRENLRRHILEGGFIEKGVDRIVEQVVQPKILPLFHPAVESAIYKYLGIENPKDKAKTDIESAKNQKKIFKPMPVAINCRLEGGTPPPGEEELELDAITPSPEPQYQRSMSCNSDNDLADEISDVSMEDVRHEEEGLERICSPISQTSSVTRKEEPPIRNDSVLSAISSGDDIPSTSGSPVTCDEFATANSPREEERAESRVSTSSDEFSSPEFEKLDIQSQSPEPTGDPPVEEKEDKTEEDDHANWRPKPGQDPDHKSDEDEGNVGSKEATSSVSIATAPAASTENSVETSEPAVTNDQKSELREKSDKEESGKEKFNKEKSVKSSSSKDRSERRSSKDRSRSKNDSHRSDRDRKDSRSSHKDKKRDRSDRSRDRDRDSKRDDRRHKSDRKDRDSKRSSHHSERERSRDRKRRESESRRDKKPSASEKDRCKESELDPSTHPKAELWKRPPEKPTALSDYLSRFPDQVFNRSYDGDLTDVSVSSVSSFEGSDFEEFSILLSEVEVDSETEETLVACGARVTYVAETIKPETAPEAAEAAENPEAKDHGDHKRVRKLNSRYSDSYVGTEWRKMESIIGSNQQPIGKSSQFNINNNSKRKVELQEFHDSGVSGCSPEDEEYLMEPEAKKVRAGSELPSSPESFQSNPLGCDPVPEESKEVSPNVSRTSRRSNGNKQPQQRYDDSDLYKPRPVITPSSRRARRSSPTSS